MPQCYGPRSCRSLKLPFAVGTCCCDLTPHSFPHRAIHRLSTRSVVITPRLASRECFLQGQHGRSAEVFVYLRGRSSELEGTVGEEKLPGRGSGQPLRAPRAGGRPSHRGRFLLRKGESIRSLRSPHALKFNSKTPFKAVCVCVCVCVCVFFVCLLVVSFT